MISQLTRSVIQPVLGIGLLFVAALSVQAANVTFQIDLKTNITAGQFIPPPGGMDYIEVRGSFNGWSSGLRLTNNPAPNTNIYTGVLNLADSLNTVESFKFIMDNGNGPVGWESIANRQFLVSATDKVLPLTTFNTSYPVSFINTITFQIDMSPAVALGKFTNGVSKVEARSDLSGWSPQPFMVNDSPANTNLYRITFTNNVAYPGSVQNYKFIVDGGNGPLGWEHDFNTIGNNRHFTVAKTNAQMLPAVYFNDENLSQMRRSLSLAKPPQAK